MEANKTALIVIDMQNDFLTGSLALKDCPAKQDGEKCIGDVNKLTKLDSFDVVVYSLDWHPKDHISFVNNVSNFPRHPNSKVDINNVQVYDNVIFQMNDNSPLEQVMWPAHCVQNSWGAELHKDLTIVQDSFLVYKGTNKLVDSYSAFFDNARLSKTNLEEILRNNNVTKVVLCGVATDVCVNFSAKDSASLGFDTTVIVDACAGVTTENISKALKEWQQLGIKCKLVSDFIS